MEKKVLDFTVLIEQDDGGVYVATVPDIQGCHTQGRTISEVVERIKEAIELCLDSDGEEIEPMRFIGIQKVQVKRPSLASN
ncbi:MAG: type II toxin-antitoxin system HicB family antitoxin [Candidatus Pacearchaeota archaeon]